MDIDIHVARGILKNVFTLFSIGDKSSAVVKEYCAHELHAYRRLVGDVMGYSVDGLIMPLEKKFGIKAEPVYATLPEFSTAGGELAQDCVSHFALSTRAFLAAYHALILQGEEENLFASGTLSRLASAVEKIEAAAARFPLTSG